VNELMHGAHRTAPGICATRVLIRLAISYHFRIAAGYLNIDPATNTKLESGLTMSGAEK